MILPILDNGRGTGHSLSSPKWVLDPRVVSEMRSQVRLRCLAFTITKWSKQSLLPGTPGSVEYFFHVQ